MGDMGEVFNDWRKVKQEKRACNRASSAQLLKDAEIGFAVLNGGAHLLVEGGKLIDFWPGTGLWIVRGTKAKHRGVAALIRFVKACGEKP